MKPQYVPSSGVVGQAVVELVVDVVPGIVVTDVVDVSCMLVKKEVEADFELEEVALATLLTVAKPVDVATLALEVVLTLAPKKDRS